MTSPKKATKRRLIIRRKLIINSFRDNMKDLNAIEALRKYSENPPNSCDECEFYMSWVYTHQPALCRIDNEFDQFLPLRTLTDTWLMCTRYDFIKKLLEVI